MMTLGSGIKTCLAFVLVFTTLSSSAASNLALCKTDTDCCDKDATCMQPRGGTEPRCVLPADGIGRTLVEGCAEGEAISSEESWSPTAEVWTEVVATMCLPATAACMNEENHCHCLTAERACPGAVITSRSCPAKFSCADRDLDFSRCSSSGSGSGEARGEPEPMPMPMPMPEEPYGCELEDCMPYGCDDPWCMAPCEAGTVFDPSDGCCGACVAGSCAPGTHITSKGEASYSCGSCEPGTFSNTVDSRVCSHCPANTWQALPGQSACVVCPPGTCTETTGSTDRTACSECPPSAIDGGIVYVTIESEEETASGSLVNDPLACPSDADYMGLINTECPGHNGVLCGYGSECCCGQCYDSFHLVCMEGMWLGLHTDACMMPTCPTEDDTALERDSTGGGNGMDETGMVDEPDSSEDGAETEEGAKALNGVEDDPSSSSSCPAATDPCMSEENHCRCLAVEKACTGSVLHLESCPLQFACDGEAGEVDTSACTANTVPSPASPTQASPSPGGDGYEDDSSAMICGHRVGAVLAALVAVSLCFF